MRIHGYSAGVIAITDDESHIREWPRINNDPVNQGWKLVPDFKQFPDLEDDGGTKPNNIKVKKENYSAQNSTSICKSNDVKESTKTNSQTKPNSDILPPQFSNLSNLTIAIVGSGFAGTITAIRILQFARKKLNLIIIHDKLNEQYGGLAYGHSTLGDYHYLNIQAGRLSLFREDPFDFMKWANEHTKDSFTEFTAVRRKTYGEYVKQRFIQAKKQSKNLVDIKECYGNVIEITESNEIVEINTIDLITGNLSQVLVDQVVLATGHEQPTVPNFIAERTKQHPYFFSSPFDKKIDQLEKFPPNKKICILGTGLTAYDAALKLKGLGFKGNISLYSRNGHRHGQYANEHSHDSIPIPLPIVKENLSCHELEKEFLNVFEKGIDFLKEYHSIDEKVIVEERTLKAMEPWISNLINKSDISEVVPFLEKFKSFLTTNRTGVVPEVGHEIEELIEGNGPKLIIRDGFDIISVNPFHDDQFNVIAIKNGKLEVFKFDAVIVCFGWESEYEKIDSTVWKLLIKRGIAQPQRKTNLGIEVNEYGELVGRNHTSRNILTVGPMRQGDELARRGRVGAFVYSIGTIRNQAVYVALRALQHIESKESIELEATTYTKLQEKLIKLIDSKASSVEVSTCYKKLCNQIKDTQFYPRYENFETLNKRLDVKLENPIFIKIYDAIYQDISPELDITKNKLQNILNPSSQLLLSISQYFNKLNFLI